MIHEKLEKLRRMDVDECLFLFGNIALIIGLLIGIFVLVYQIPIGSGDNCIFYRYTNLYCVGCGGTRAMLAFFKGNLLVSMKYHAFTTYGMSLYFIYMGSHYLSRLTKGRVKGLHFRMVYIYIGVALLVGQFILRNIMLVRYGSILWPVSS